MKNKKSTKLIPKGYYCYTRKNGEFIPCPYWSKDYTHDEQENGYCAYLGKGDWDINSECADEDVEVQSCYPDGTSSVRIEKYRDLPPTSLLWDQCKECNVKRGLGFWRELLLFLQYARFG